MAQRFDANALRRQIKQAQDKAQRELKRVVDDHNRKVEAHNKKVVADYNRKVAAHNREAEKHNTRVIAELNRRLQGSGARSVTFTPEETQLAERVQDAVLGLDTREYDVFLSYARIDGSVVATDLRDELEGLGVSVWFDEVAIRPGKSQSLQMDSGLRRARAGVVVLTAAYLAGRFWTERELGALLHKPTLIPVLHGVTFKDVAEYSGILPDLAGFTTDRDSVTEIAAKIAIAVAPAADS